MQLAFQLGEIKIVISPTMNEHSY